MPPAYLFDLDQIDTSRVEASREAIYRVLPHRHEFMLLDGVCHLDLDTRRIVAFKDIRPDDWWVRGHVPNRPLFPGVLFVEAAAQMVSYYSHVAAPDVDRFLGFAGIDDVKFRGTVVPTCRLVMLGNITELKPRRVTCRTQGVVDGKLVFEGTITGMRV